MKAMIFNAPKDMIVKDIPEPRKPKKGEILTRTLTCSLCYTEVAVWRGAECSTFPPGSIFGHENCSEVIEVGPDTEGWEVGDWMTLCGGSYRCGKCLACRAGLLCTDRSHIDEATKSQEAIPFKGFFTEYVVSDIAYCHKLPKGISAIGGSNVEPIACSVHFLRRAGIEQGANIVFFGIEDYTLGCLHWAKQGGSSKIIVVDSFANRREMALKYGADVVLDPDGCEVVAEIAKIMPFGADISFVSTEDFNPRSFRYYDEAGMATRTRGTLFVARLCWEKGFIFNYPQLPYFKQIDIKSGGQYFTDEPERGGALRGDMAVSMEMINNKKIDAEGYVTIVPWEEIKTAKDANAFMENQPTKVFKNQLKFFG